MTGSGQHLKFPWLFLCSGSGVRLHLPLARPRGLHCVCPQAGLSPTSPLPGQHLGGPSSLQPGGGSGAGRSTAPSLPSPGSALLWCAGEPQHCTHAGVGLLSTAGEGAGLHWVYWAGLWTPGLRTQAGSFTGITARVQRRGSWAVVCEGR